MHSTTNYPPLTTNLTTQMSPRPNNQPTSQPLTFTTTTHPECMDQGTRTPRTGINLFILALPLSLYVYVCLSATACLPACLSSSVWSLSTDVLKSPSPLTPATVLIHGYLRFSQPTTAQSERRGRSIYEKRKGIIEDRETTREGKRKEIDEWTELASRGSERKRDDQSWEMEARWPKRERRDV